MASKFWSFVQIIRCILKMSTRYTENLMLINLKKKLYSYKRNKEKYFILYDVWLFKKDVHYLSFKECYFFFFSDRLLILFSLPFI